MTRPCELTLAHAVAALMSRQLSARELLADVLDRLDTTEPVVHAWASVDRDGARTAAELADDAIATGRSLGPLHGIPIGLKDVIATGGWLTEGGSDVLRGHVPDVDATVTARLRGAGAVVLGKTVTHEFAYGQGVPPTRNPWDPTRYPGGSSAGSGVAVAVGSALAALGTDTGGSVRNPAAVNGIVGLKPTNGLISRAGVMPVSASLDQVGPLTRNVADCALVLQAVSGHDPRDPGSLAVPPVDCSAALSAALGRWRVGIPVGAVLHDQVAPPIRDTVLGAVEVLRRAGAEVIDVDIPLMAHALPAGVVIALAESAVWHRPMLVAHRDRYLPGTRVMTTLGALVSAADYLTAQRAREIIRDDVRRVMEAHRLDVLLGPTLPGVAGPAEALATDLTRGGDVDDLSGALRLLSVANVTGLPAISVPCGMAEGHPVGLHLMGRPLDEPRLLRIAAEVEALTWPGDTWPPVVAAA